MNKKIAIYFSDEGKYAYPFDKKEYLEAYIDVINKIKNQGIDVFIVRGDSYEGEGMFNKSYILNSKNEIEESGKIKVDLIFNRDNNNTIPYIEDCKIINDPEFDKICLDKMLTFKYFPEISPKTSYINSYEDFLEKNKEFNFDDETFIVLKKNFETEGNGIYIGKIGELEKDFYSDWTDILYQEYIDTSVGIDGIVEGKHDIRITLINGKIISGLIRVPKEGSYLANIAKGGSSFGLDIEKIPKDLLEKIDFVNKKIGKYDSLIFSADFMNSKNGFKLVELNSRPGLQHPNWNDKYYLFNDEVVNLLVNAVKKD